MQCADTYTNKILNIKNIYHFSYINYNINRTTPIYRARRD